MTGPADHYGHMTLREQYAHVWTNGTCHVENIKPAVFFPGSDAKAVDAAKQICARCPVQEDCLEYAIITREDFGVWGGTSERERDRIRKSRATRVA